MPQDIALADETWARYQYARDHGHLEYVRKAAKCEQYVIGKQWDARDEAVLRAQNRPHLTINKMLPTLANVMGEQIFNRTQISFQPAGMGASSKVADVLAKVMGQIGENNQMEWVRADVFCDGITGSRGYFDVRMKFNDSLMGEVEVGHLNPKNVLPDPDAVAYDPDTWGDVIVTKWMSPDEISIIYNEKDGRELRTAVDDYSLYGHDAFDFGRDRFGEPNNLYRAPGDDHQNGLVRSVRVLERQHRKLAKTEHFVDPTLGDMRAVPSEWDRDRISLYLQNNPNLTITKKPTLRIRWSVVAGRLVLHDDWSPYQHFTVVPYFPFFIRGATVGLAENLVGPQDYLNKITSQELHVVNTTANSGWIVETGNLTNMSPAELENTGGRTGLVIEVNKKDGIEKITPNATPTGLDRLSYKAEEAIKSISGVSDYRTGQAREDVSAKAVRANQSAGSANTAKMMDNLQRTDFLLGRNILNLIQTFYTEERLIHITTDRFTQATEELQVNQMSPEGQIINDLTIGEYRAVVTTQPERDNLEDSQFDQAVAMKEQGVAIPDSVLVKSSRLRDKDAILKEMAGDQESPEALEAKALEKRGREAAVAVEEGTAKDKEASAAAKLAKAQADAEGPAGELEKVKLEHQRKMQEMQETMAMEREEHQMKMQIEREKADQKMELETYKAQQAAKIAEDQSQADTVLKESQAVAAVKTAEKTPAAPSTQTKAST